MKLKVKILETPVGGPFIVLCDEKGELLPGQTGATLKVDIEDAPRLTVSFVVDGQDIELVQSK